MVHARDGARPPRSRSHGSSSASSNDGRAARGVGARARSAGVERGRGARQRGDDRHHLAASSRCCTVRSNLAQASPLRSRRSPARRAPPPSPTPHLPTNRRVPPCSQLFARVHGVMQVRDSILRLFILYALSSPCKRECPTDCMFSKYYTDNCTALHTDYILGQNNCMPTHWQQHHLRCRYVLRHAGYICPKLPESAPVRRQRCAVCKDGWMPK